MRNSGKLLPRRAPRIGRNLGGIRWGSSGKWQLRNCIVLVSAAPWHAMPRPRGMMPPHLMPHSTPADWSTLRRMPRSCSASAPARRLRDSPYLLEKYRKPIVTLSCSAWYRKPGGGGGIGARGFLAGVPLPGELPGGSKVHYLALPDCHKSRRQPCSGPRGMSGRRRGVYLDQPDPETGTTPDVADGRHRPIEHSNWCGTSGSLAIRANMCWRCRSGNAQSGADAQVSRRWITSRSAKC